MKPSLKSYVAFVPVSEGVYFEAGARQFLLKGRGLYPLVQQLTALLDGTRSVAAIEALIPPQAHKIFRMLLSELDQKRMLFTQSEEVGAALSTTEAELYAETLAYLREEDENASALFFDWRETPVLAAGNGVALQALVAGLLASGVRRLRWLVEPGETARDDEIAVADRCLGWKQRDCALDAGPATLAAALAEPSSCIVYAADRIPNGPSSVFATLSADDRKGSLYGGIRNGLALIGPASEGNGLINRLWQSIDRPPTIQRYSEATRMMIGALTAAEALRQRMFAASSDRRNRVSPFGHLRRVSPDGTVTLHACPPATERLNWPIRDTGESSSVGDPLNNLFDPLTGCLAWATSEKHDFPLAHRAVSLPSGELVFQWAISPLTVARRASLQAAAVLIERERADIVPIAVSMVEDGWRDYAIADAVVRTEWFAGSATVWRVDPDTIDDGDARTLLRLMRLYDDAVPSIWVAADPVWPAAFVCVAFAGKVVRIAAPDRVEAIREALGDALSMAQIGRVPNRQTEGYWGPMARLGPWPWIDEAKPIDAVSASDGSAMPIPVPTLIPLTDAHLASAGLFAGRATIGAGA